MRPLWILRVIYRRDFGVIHRTAFQIGDKAACDVRVHQTAVDKGRCAVGVGRDEITYSVNQLVDFQNAGAVFLGDKVAQTIRVVVCRFRESAGLRAADKAACKAVCICCVDRFQPVNVRV